MGAKTFTQHRFCTDLCQILYMQQYQKGYLPFLGGSSRWGTEGGMFNTPEGMVGGTPATPKGQRAGVPETFPGGGISPPRSPPRGRETPIPDIGAVYPWVFVSFEHP